MVLVERASAFSPAMDACKICANEVGNRIHIAREMMFGFRDRFSYLECGYCGCLQLLNAPTEPARYYPKSYYSYQTHGLLMTTLRRKWSAFAFGERSFIGKLLSELYFPNRAMMALRRMGISAKARVLDVGCGSGNLLLDLKHFGFQHVTGVDAFIECDLAYPGGPRIFKMQLGEMSGEYDVLMLHHSFEHMADPLETLRSISRLLASGGTIIIRIPISSSYGWRHYGVNWVGLDAPRHLFLHTYKSIDLLANQVGLAVSSVTHETDDGTFWASEAYARDISMNDPRFPNSNILKRFLSCREILRLRAEARKVNERLEADMVCLYLKRRELRN
jgi:2-polyprenyl-3-methyl-5-hydroxy-6-metoxy-1,4-benzoquinol methylase